MPPVSEEVPTLTATCKARGGPAISFHSAKMRRYGSQGCQGDEGRSWVLTWELAPATSTDTGDKRRVRNAQLTWRTSDLDEQCTK